MYSEIKNEKPSQISVATKAPAVPGAKGEKPEPNPVQISTSKKEGFFIKNFKRKSGKVTEQLYNILSYHFTTYIIDY